MDKAIPYGVEETGGVDRASGTTLPQQTWEQQPTLESLTLNADPRLQIIVKYGNLEQEKVDVLVYPLQATKPNLGELNVNKELMSKAGEKFCNLFSTVLTSKGALKPGDCISLPIAEGSYSLQCTCVKFITCSTWSPCNSTAEKDLRDGIRMFLHQCNSVAAVKSVAVSALGTGAALNFPNELAATIMGEEIKSFVERHPHRNLKEVRIVIKQLQRNETAYIAYREKLLAMNLGQQIKLCKENGGSFTRTVLGQHTQKKAGRLTVSVVYGDIGEESTDAIVNSTNFATWGPHSVAARIFTAVGPDILKTTREAHSTGCKLVLTTAVPLPCKWILHCNCGGKLNNIPDLVSEILAKCEHVGLQSVAIPAIGAGECKFRPEDVACHMMKSISHFTEKTNLKCLSCVRLITYSPYIYHTFCAEQRKHFI
ncbi:protein mono-ADP-ribosyltransferase PARP14-like isoform X2 [Eleutherodactylus coqui]